MNTAINPHGHIRIYGCGGFGVNIAKTFASAANNVEPGYAEAHPTYIDTSRSNLDNTLQPEAVFLLEDVDGSGKVRSENHVQISRTVKSILQNHEPKDFNIVLFSASGGSGSVIGPLIIRELLSRNQTVVGIVVGSDESAITARNTLKTLQSLEVIAEKTEAPVVIYFEMNEKNVRRSEIDVRCRHVISCLSVLASRQNAEMDTRDIGNWTHFNRSTSVGARLALFEVYNDNQNADEAVNPVAIASLYKSPDDDQIHNEPEYSTVGYIRDGVKNAMTTHFVIGLDGIPVIYRRMEDKVAEQQQATASRVVHDKIASSRDANDEGLVF